MIDESKIVLPRLLTVEQVAELLQVSTRTVWRLRGSERIPKPVVFGGSLRWRADELQTWIEAGCPEWQPKSDSKR